MLLLVNTTSDLRLAIFQVPSTHGHNRCDLVIVIQHDQVSALTRSELAFAMQS